MGTQCRELPRNGRPLPRSHQACKFRPKKSPLRHFPPPRVRSLCCLSDCQKFQAACVGPKGPKCYLSAVQRAKRCDKVLRPDQFVSALNLRHAFCKPKATEVHFRTQRADKTVALARIFQLDGEGTPWYGRDVGRDFAGLSVEVSIRTFRATFAIGVASVAFVFSAPLLSCSPSYPFVLVRLILGTSAHALMGLKD